MRATLLYRALAAVHAIDGCSKRSVKKSFDRIPPAATIRPNFLSRRYFR
jgi:hypothetical protein